MKTFRIIITVENGNEQLSITQKDKKNVPSIAEIIGTLDMMKHKFIQEFVIKNQDIKSESHIDKR